MGRRRAAGSIGRSCRVLCCLRRLRAAVDVRGGSAQVVRTSSHPSRSAPPPECSAGAALRAENGRRDRRRPAAAPAESTGCTPEGRGTAGRGVKGLNTHTPPPPRPGAAPPCFCRWLRGGMCWRGSGHPRVLGRTSLAGRQSAPRPRWRGAAKLRPSLLSTLGNIPPAVGRRPARWCGAAVRGSAADADGLGGMTVGARPNGPACPDARRWRLPLTHTPAHDPVQHVRLAGGTARRLHGRLGAAEWPGCGGRHN